MELQNKLILVIGLKRTGLSVARFVSHQGGRVRIADHLPAEALRQELDSLANLPCDLRLGTHEPAAVLDGVDLLIPSPGVPADAPLLRAAHQQGVPIWSEIELAFRFLACPLFAITGTNGKSTTTSLLGAMVQQSGKRVFVGGNLGTPLLNALMAPSYDAAVAEISSFQLEWIDQFRPHIGIFLNLTEDHLDRHKSLACYGMTKRALFTKQQPTDWAVVNRDDPEVWKLAQNLPGRLFSFGWQPVEAGAWIENDTLVIRHQSQDIRCALDRLRLYGRHNLENVMAAASAAFLWGVSPSTIASVLASFTGLPHRLEIVAEKQGVRYFDDSKGTNVGAVVQSLASFSGPVILLAGGVDKGGDYSPLRSVVREKVKLLLLFGQARELICNALGNEAPTLVVDTLATAVREAAAAAAPGDTVLLSPACASFDQFENYVHRGKVFRSCVEGL